MPTIGTLCGVVLRIYYEDDAPPHVHAYYRGQAARLEMDRFTLIDGKLPRDVLAELRKHALEHLEEIRMNWRRSLEHAPLLPLGEEES